MDLYVTAAVSTMMLPATAAPRNVVRQPSAWETGLTVALVLMNLATTLALVAAALLTIAAFVKRSSAALRSMRASVVLHARSRAFSLYDIRRIHGSRASTYSTSSNVVGPDGDVVDGGTPGDGDRDDADSAGLPTNVATGGVGPQSPPSAASVSAALTPIGDMERVVGLPEVPADAGRDARPAATVSPSRRASMSLAFASPLQARAGRAGSSSRVALALVM